MYYSSDGSRKEIVQAAIKTNDTDIFVSHLAWGEMLHSVIILKALHSCIVKLSIVARVVTF